MKKQDTSSLRSSSYRQENSPKNLQAKSIGCMSSIFQLIYKYNNRRRGKFITSGKKQQKESNSNNAVGNCNNNVTRLTCDVPRSPTLPSEIRRGNSMETDAEMRFLEEAAEKRRKLIEAVEKCDEDLKELKKIIDVVKNSVSVDNQVDLEPSPVSVLDDFTPLPSVLSSPSSYARRYANGGAVVEEQQRVQKQKRKEGDDDDEEEESNISLVEKMKIISERRIINEGRRRCRENLIISPPIMWGRKAMIESVNQVCGDIEWGETREIGRLGLALQHFIFRDLIDDFVLQLSSFSLYSLPFQSSRRSLRF